MLSIDGFQTNSLLLMAKPIAAFYNALYFILLPCDALHVKNVFSFLLQYALVTIRERVLQNKKGSLALGSGAKASLNAPNGGTSKTSQGTASETIIFINEYDVKNEN